MNESPSHAPEEGNETSPSAPDATNGPAPASSKRPTSTNQMPPPPHNPPLSAMEAKRADLEATLQNLLQKRSSLASTLRAQSSSPPTSFASPDEPIDEADAQTIAAAQRVVRRQIARLQRYNEIKDVGQGLLGLIAEHRGVRIAEVMAEFGVEERD